MSKLRLAPDLALPEEAVTSTLVVYGGKGMGKTNFGSVFVEELTKAHLRWALLDPMGVAWGLRHSKDGKGPGIECVLLGGAHGDIPIEPTGGAIVADLVVDENANVIIDFSRKATGQMWTLGEKVRFVTDYTLRLFQRQGELIGGRRREPLMQILDEAARYIPQQIPSGAIDLARCVGAWEQVCEEGRNIGLGVAFLTQRSARMNKSVSELADVMVAFRTIGPNSLAAIMDWLGEHVDKARSKELSAQVRELHVGQALVVSPGWLKIERVVDIRARETFDSSATPKPGERQQKVSGPAAKPDLAKYQAKMVETIERAKADDPKVLRARIHELERDLAKKPVAVRSEELVADSIARGKVGRDLQRTIVNLRKGLESAMRIVTSLVAVNFDAAGVSKEEIVQALESGLGRVAAIVDHRVSARTAEITALQREAARIQTALSKLLAEAGQDVEVVLNVTKQEPFTVESPRRVVASRKPSTSNPTPGAVGGTAQRMLNALRFLESVGTSPASRAAIAGLVGVSWDTGTFRTYLSELRTAGFIADGPGTNVSLTDAGRAQASDDGLPQSQRELHDAWLTKVGGTAGRMLRVLIEEYPRGVTRAALGEACGIDHTTGTFRTYLSELRSPGLINDVDKQTVRAADALFPEGLR